MQLSKYSFLMIFSILIVYSSMSYANMGGWGDWGKRCETQTTCGACSNGSQTCTEVYCDGDVKHKSVSCDTPKANSQNGAYKTVEVSGYCRPKINCQSTCKNQKQFCEVVTCQGKQKKYEASCQETLLSREASESSKQKS